MYSTITSTMHTNHTSLQSVLLLNYKTDLALLHIECYIITIKITKNINLYKNVLFIPENNA